MITKESIETAYSFIHQKLRIYKYSTLDWQKDDIEYAIDSFVETMNPDLYALLSNGNTGYLRDHKRFLNDMTEAAEKLANMLFNITN